MLKAGSRGKFQFASICIHVFGNGSSSPCFARREGLVPTQQGVCFARAFDTMPKRVGGGARMFSLQLTSNDLVLQLFGRRRAGT